MVNSVTKSEARRAAAEMVKSIGAPAKRNEDVSGVVRRIDPDGTRWVQLPGDEGLTPCVENAVETMMGDDVTVRIGNHSASIVKNNTKPPDGRTSEKVDEIRAGVGKFDDLYATTATVSVLVAENATLEQVRAAQVYAKSVNAQLVAAPVAQFDEICAESATVQDITANVARIDTAELKQLNADVATFGVVGAKYARIDAANIDTATMREAWVDSLMVQTGLISHAGTIYELDAIQVNASKIKAGTLDVERLIVTVGGEKYLVHVDAQGTAAYQKLDGNIVEDLTITTDKLVAGAVTAQKITTENIVGTGGWINLRSGTFSYVNATSGQGISWDGTTLTVNGNVTVGGSTMSLTDVASMAADAAASKVWEGTCSTGESTAAKVVTCPGLTELAEGTTIRVEFVERNYAHSLMLNVNSLGAKSVRVNDAVESTSNKLLWNGGAVIEFRYDGMYWNVVTKPTRYTASCSTAADNTHKNAEVSKSVVQRNTEVSVTFTYAHASQDAALLYITGSVNGEQLIYDGFSLINTTNGNSWKAGKSITFVFNGNIWMVADSSARKEAADAATKATNYVTDITGGGVMVHPSDDSTSGWKIAGALELLRAGVSQIWAGIESTVAVIRVGLANAGNVVMSGDGYVDVRHGSDVMAHFGYGSGAAESGSANAPYYTLGKRSGSTVGNYSVAEGWETEASGFASHAEGHYALARGKWSHAEGNSSLASGWAAHAEGAGTADGNYSHAEGNGTEAYSANQHVQGRYNVRDSSGTYAHIVGNGSPGARSNAHTLDWNGNAWFSGGVQGTSISDGTGTLAQLRESVSQAQGTVEVLGGGVVSNLVYSLVRFGPIVNLSARFRVTNLPLGTLSVLIVPEGFRPNASTGIEITWYDNDNDLPCAGRVYQDGVFNIYSTSRNLTSGLIYINEFWSTV